MSGTTASVIVIVVVVVVCAAVTIYALHTKGNVRASGQIGSGSFSIDTTEKQK